MNAPEPITLNIAIGPEAQRVDQLLAGLAESVDATREALCAALHFSTPAAKAAEEYSPPLAFWPFACNDAHPNALLDAALFSSASVQCVPLYAPFERRTTNGHNYLVASNGLWLECRRPWMHLIWPVSKLTAPVPLPFGHLKPHMETRFGKMPHDALREFADLAVSAGPNEAGAWMTWATYAADASCGFEGSLEWFRPGISRHISISNGDKGCMIVTGTPGSLEYDCPATTGTSTPCIDIHSHGYAPAFFSPTDDADDAGAVKIAIVLGNLDRPVPSIVARLCCLGLTIPIPADAEAIFGAAAYQQAAEAP